MITKKYLLSLLLMPLFSFGMNIEVQEVGTIIEASTYFNLKGDLMLAKRQYNESTSIWSSTKYYTVDKSVKVAQASNITPTGEALKHAIETYIKEVENIRSNIKG